ncbi:MULTISPECIES: AraC family transcriptional regulator [unclassified Novosphingobium]|uniref:helix-turn-helix transcriptional regulator n=1 Tax=unclassified Novosphingobium TaxID=2644732 RepID=UPI0025E8F95F|nr:MULTISPECIES: AraC family transcriptional regulator [unclassified Novosphingobium]HQV03520.1 AraC family transcriptional regulator [Novosphingobium sp.]
MNDLIPPEHIKEWIPGRKTIDSTAQGWRGLTLMGYRYAGLEVEIPPMRDYMIVVYQDADTCMRRRCNGPWQSERLGSGAVSLLTRGEQSTWQWDNAINVRHIYLGHSAISETAAQIFDRDVASIDISDRISIADNMIPLCLGFLEQEYHGIGVGEHLFIDALRTQLAVHIIRNYANISIKESHVGALGTNLRKSICEYIEESLGDRIHLEDLASIVGLSPFHFSRKFKIEFGLTPHAYVIQRKIERAKAMLLMKNTPLKVIAADCGFSDQSHLNRTFRKALGVTPAEFRRCA